MASGYQKALREDLSAPTSQQQQQQQQQRTGGVSNNFDEDEADKARKARANVPLRPCCVCM